MFVMFLFASRLLENETSSSSSFLKRVAFIFFQESEIVIAKDRLCLCILCALEFAISRHLRDGRPARPLCERAER